jgi:hypothetical protein
LRSKPNQEPGHCVFEAERDCAATGSMVRSILMQGTGASRGKGADLCGASVIVVQDPAKPLPTNNGAGVVAR